MEFYKLNIEKFNNNNITNNVAGIFGGGIYLFNYNSNKTVLFNMNNNSIIKNNKAGSNVIENYSSRPSYISLKNINEKSFIEAKAKDYISLYFIFKDIFNKDVLDTSNYY